MATHTGAYINREARLGKKQANYSNILIVYAAYVFIVNCFQVLAGKAACPAYEYAYSALMDSEEFQKLNDRFTYLYNYLTQYTGRTVKSLDDLQRLNNTFFIEELYNKTLPEWTKNVYPSTDMTWVADFTFSIATYTRHLARLKMGPLIKEMFQRFADKSKGKLNPDRSVWIYSAHDTTVANVLNTLKLFDVRYANT